MAMKIEQKSNSVLPSAEDVHSGSASGQAVPGAGEREGGHNPVSPEPASSAPAVESKIVPRLVDLHSHYAMHFYPDGHSDEIGDQKRFWSKIEAFVHPREEVRTWLLELGNRILNYQSGKPRVTVETLTAGGVGVALSPLHQFLDEIDLDLVRVDWEPPFLPANLHVEWPVPDCRYFANLVTQMMQVTHHVATKHAERASVVRDWRELEAAWIKNRVALAHAVEGGFSVGSNEQEIRTNVRVLASLGVVYITVAHLFYRQLATNVAAIPQWADQSYHHHFEQPKNKGLTSLGCAMVEAMVDEGIFLDLTHMSERASLAALALLDAKDPARRIPVMITHGAYRFTKGGGVKPDPGREYNLTDDQIVRIAQRKGLIGILLCDVDLADNLAPTDAHGYVLAHIQRIAEVIEHAAIPGVDKYDCLALGTDLDGYVRPPHGIETAADLKLLAQTLQEKLGPSVAERIANGNALRVLKSGFLAHGEAAPPGRRVPWAPLP